MAPNNSFKPNLLRYSNGVAEEACHAVASTTQVGLTRTLASQQERMCSVSFSLLCSPLAFGRAMKNTNLNAQHSNFKKLIFQVVLPGETEALI